MPKQYIILPWDLKRWPDIKQKLSLDINNVVDLDNTICSFNNKLRSRSIIEMFIKYQQECDEWTNSNSSASDDKNTSSVHKFLPSTDEIIKKLIPFMKGLILNGSKLFKNYPVKALVPQVKTNITLSRPQVATIISCAFFNLFNYNYLTKGSFSIDIFPELTFLNVYMNQNIFALQCLINYFNQVYGYMNHEDQNHRDIFDASNIIIYRNVLNYMPEWGLSGKPLCEVALSEGNIDGSPAKLHVCFSSDYICGNAFEGSLSPEEVTFLVRPECMVSILLCAQMCKNESISILGTEKMSDYSGYMSGVKYNGIFADDTMRGFSKDNTEVLIQNIVIAIDATTRTSGVTQYIQDFDRDLYKAYCGFSTFNFSHDGEPIATGNWGCGSYGGNNYLKFIQQLLAASQANKSLIYHSNNKLFENKLIEFLHWLQKSNLSVGDLYMMYKKLIKKCYTGPYSRLSELDIFECLQDM